MWREEVTLPKYDFAIDCYTSGTGFDKENLRFTRNKEYFSNTFGFLMRRLKSMGKLRSSKFSARIRKERRTRSLRPYGFVTRTKRIVYGKNKLCIGTRI